MLHIITDSTTDMPESWYSEYNIHVIPMEITIKDQTYQDIIEISKEDFYRKSAEAGIVPRTACPAPGKWAQLIESIAKPGDTILTFHISSPLSGSYNAARIAAEELRNKYRVIPFDTLGGSTLVGFMCKVSREMDRTGQSLDAILERLKAIREEFTICFALDTLKFALGSGRYAGIANAVASIIKVKPLVFVQKNGSMRIDGVARTLNKAMERMLDVTFSRYGSRPVNVGVMYAQEVEHANRYLEMIRSKLNVQEVILENINLTIACHIGPGAVGMMAYPTG